MWLRQLVTTCSRLTGTPGTNEHTHTHTHTHTDRERERKLVTRFSGVNAGTGDDGVFDPPHPLLPDTAGGVRGRQAGRQAGVCDLVHVHTTLQGGCGRRDMRAWPWGREGGAGGWGWVVVVVVGLHQ